MPVTNRSTLAEVDGDAALEAVRETIDGTLYSFCEYDTERFRPLYVDEQTIAMYEDQAAMIDHFEQIHANVHMDFMQTNLFRNTLFPVAERVEHITTRMDFLKIVRFYVGDNGLFLAIEPDEPVEPLVETIKDAIEWPPNQNP